MAVAASMDTRYGTARVLASFLEVIGWIVIVLGCLGSIMATINFGLWGSLAGIGAVFSGLIIIVFAQVLKATVDTADNTRAMLAEMRRQNHLGRYSKQS
jgi:hypothetical protein